MNSALSKLKTWFNEYTRQFLTDDPVAREAIGYKIAHTRRVCETTLEIALDLGLSQKDLDLAETAALLHDIGRFEQYRRHGTYADYKSENHALLGVKVLKANHILSGLDPETAQLVMWLVGCHNRFTLPRGETKRGLFFLKLLRDADKVDIWRVVTAYYADPVQNGNRAFELDMPETPRVSGPVCEALLRGRQIQMKDVKTLNDFKLLQMGWAYDVNFPPTFKIIFQNEFVEKIRKAITELPPADAARVEKIHRRIRAHMEKNVSAGASRPPSAGG